MNTNLKTCVYQSVQTELVNYFRNPNFINMGFEINVSEGCFQDLFAYMSSNKVDIFVLDTTDLDKARCSFVIEIVYKNFCKNILLITDEKYYLYEGMNTLSFQDKENFDLKLNNVLFSMKRDIDSKPSRNVTVLKNKICNLLLDLHFNCKRDGFQYYVESIYRMFLCFPYKYSMMDIYEEVGNVFGKTGYAVEKSMRSLLINATKRVKLLPSNKENDKIKSFLTYDMNNKLLTSMLVQKLMQDREINESLDAETKGLIYQ